MSGVVCAWASLPDEVLEWYETEFLPQQRNVEAQHSIHCEVTASGMEHEPVGKLDAAWPFLTVYEVKDVAQTNREIDIASNDLPEAAKSGPLKHVNFDVRSYREVKRWQNEDFEGNGSAGKNISLNEAQPQANAARHRTHRKHSSHGMDDR